MLLAEFQKRSFINLVEPLSNHNNINKHQRKYNKLTV